MCPHITMLSKSTKDTINNKHRAGISMSCNKRACVCAHTLMTMCMPVCAHTCRHNKCHTVGTKPPI